MSLVAPTVDYSSVAWFPQPGSIASFFTCPISEILLHGPRWCGKTDAALMAFCRHVGKGYGPAWRGLVFRQQYPDLEDIIQKTRVLFKRIYGDRAVFTKSPNPVWRWDTGEELMLRCFDTEADYDSYHGWSVAFQFWDEISNWASPNGYLRMGSIMKSTHPQVKDLCFRVCTANPSGPGRGWVMDRFEPTTNRIIDDARDAQGNLDPPRMSIQCYLEENVALMEAVPDAIQKIRASCTNPAEVAAWVFGDWTVTAGGIIDHVWEDKVHVVDDFDIPREWYLDKCYDFGSSSPWACAWFAESDGCDVVLRNGRWSSTVAGDLFVIGEVYGFNGRPNEGDKKSVADQAKAIIQQEQALGLYGRVAPGPGDVWNVKSIVSANTLQDEFLKPVWLDSGQMAPGIQWTRPNKGPTSVKDGWQIMQRRLRDAKPSPNKPRENPGLFVFRSCHHWLRTVPTLPRDPKKPDHDHPKSENHCLSSETIVDTEFGPRAILDLVGTTGRVWTDQGLKEYRSCRLTRKQQQTVRVTLRDGRRITCTPDHQVWTADGISTRADQLKGCRILSACPKPCSTLRDSTGGVAEPTSPERQLGCTGKFGWPTEVLYLMDGTFITLTTIVPTTDCRILPACLGDSISRTTCPQKKGLSCRGKHCLRPAQPRPSGIDRPRADSGTVTSGEAPSALGKACTAFTVKQSSRESEACPSTVQTTASLPPEELQASTISNGPVLSVEQSSSAINTGVLCTAVEVVQVELAQISDVYCLEVPGLGRFCVEGGLVVSNCADLTRYRLLADGRRTRYGKVMGMC